MAGGWRAIHIASYDGSTEVVAILLKAGAEVNVFTDTFHETPLVLAAMNGHVATMKLLLKAGADLELQNSCGKTAGEYAVSLNKHAAVDALSSWKVRARAGVENRGEHRPHAAPRRARRSKSGRARGSGAAWPRRSQKRRGGGAARRSLRCSS